MLGQSLRFVAHINPCPNQYIILFLWPSFLLSYIWIGDLYHFLSYDLWWTRNMGISDSDVHNFLDGLHIGIFNFNFPQFNYGTFLTLSTITGPEVFSRNVVCTATSLSSSSFSVSFYGWFSSSLGYIWYGEIWHQEGRESLSHEFNHPL